MAGNTRQRRAGSRTGRRRTVRPAPAAGDRKRGDSGTDGSQTLRWREVDSNHRFLVGRSNRDGRRAWLSRKRSGSLGEPKVRIHLPPPASLLRTRLPRSGDLEACHACKVGAYPVPAGPGLPGEQIADTYLARLQQEVAEKRGAIFIAERNGVFAGIAVGWIIERDHIPESADSNRFGYLSGIDPLSPPRRCTMDCASVPGRIAEQPRKRGLIEEFLAEARGWVAILDRHRDRLARPGERLLSKSRWASAVDRTLHSGIAPRPRGGPMQPCPLARRRRSRGQAHHARHRPTLPPPAALATPSLFAWPLIRLAPGSERVL
jgi:hypothetical protein